MNLIINLAIIYLTCAAVGLVVWNCIRSDDDDDVSWQGRAMIERPLGPQLLKFCPFCGLTDIDTISPDMGETPAVSMHSYPGGFRVECEGCGCNGPWHHDHQAALDAWDYRHNDPVLARPNDDLMP